MPQNKSKVEAFRLTDAMRQWIKTFKRVDGMKQVLEQGLQRQMSELEQSQKMFEQADGMRKQMLQKAPLGQEKELPGQEERA